MASRQERKEQARTERLAAEEAERRSARRRASIMRLGLVAALAVVVIVVGIVLSTGSGNNAVTTTASGAGADAEEVAALFRGIPQEGVYLGRAKAPTLIEFADLQCPYCAEYARDALPTVVRRYVRTGRLRYELRLRSFLGSDSVRAAGAAAVATRENRLYQFSEIFYRRQQHENTGYVTADFIRGVARAAGVDPNQAVAAATDGNQEPLVRQAEQMAAQLGSQSTPAFFLRLRSGRLVPVQPQDLTGDAMSAALDQVLPARA